MGRSGISPLTPQRAFYAADSFCSQYKDAEVLQPFGRAEKGCPQHPFCRGRYGKQHLRKGENIERDTAGENDRTRAEREFFYICRYSGLNAVLWFVLHCAKIIQPCFLSKQTATDNCFIPLHGAGMQLSGTPGNIVPAPAACRIQGTLFQAKEYSTQGSHLIVKGNYFM